jgi:hypothetical protein
MIISFKSWRTLFRHSEVLCLRRELRRKEKAWEEERRQLIDAALTSRGGRPAFREPTPPKEFQPTGYVPPTHPMRRPQAVPVAETLNEDERGALDKFKKEAQG